MPLSHETSIPIDQSAIVLPTLETTTPASDDASLRSSAPPRPNQTTVWDVPFDCVTLQEAVAQIERLIEHGEPGYVITAKRQLLDASSPPQGYSADH